MSEEINWISTIVNWFPMLLLIGVWVYFMRKMGGGASGMTHGQYLEQLLAETKRHKEQMEKLLAVLNSHLEQRR